MIEFFRKLFTPSKRALDAAGGGRRWRDDRPIRDAASVTHNSAGLVAARAASYVMNSPHGSRIVESLVGNLVGTGIVPRPLHPSEQVRERLARDFASWADQADATGRTDLYGLQAAATRDLVVSGEALLTWTTDPVTGAPQLRRLSPEQLDRSKTVKRDGTTVINGVELDAGDRIVAHWLRPPAADPLATIALTPERVVASEVVHLFRQLSPGQVRGLSWFAPILLSANDLNALADAMLMRAKVAALHAGFVVAPDEAPPYDGTTTNSTMDVSLEPGAMVVLPPGKSVEFPDVPSQDGATALMTSTLRAIAAGVGVTYEQMTGDYSQVNYSSARAALLEFRRYAESIQYGVIIHQLLKPVWNRFVRWEVLRGAIPAVSYRADPSAFGAKWLPPRWAWIDPQKDANAAVTELTNNLRSRSEIVAEMGNDIEQIDKEIAADQERARRLGIEAKDSTNENIAQPSADARSARRRNTKGDVAA